MFSAMENLLCVSLLWCLPLWISAGKLCGSDGAYRNGSCWALGARALPPFQAERECGTKGGRTASLHSREELDFATALASSSGGEVWLGGAEGWPRWTDGTPWDAPIRMEAEWGLQLNRHNPCWVMVGSRTDNLRDYPSIGGGDMPCQSPSANGTCPRADQTAALGRCLRLSRYSFPDSCAPRSLADACQRDDPASWPISLRDKAEADWVRNDWPAAGGKTLVVGAFSRSDNPEANLLRWTDGTVLDFRPSFAADGGRDGGKNLVSLRPKDGLLVARNPNSAHLKALCRKKLSSDSAYYVKLSSEAESDESALRCAERCLAAGGCGAFATEPCLTDAPPSISFVSKATPAVLVQHPATCAEVKARKASATSGVHLLRLPSDPAYECEEGSVHCEFEAACDLGVGGGDWTLLQRQEKGDEDFNRTMHEYELGFGTKEGDHWLGLWKLQSLAAYRPSELLIRARFVGDNCTQWALYENFRVLSYDGYPFHYDSFHPASSLPDALLALKGTASFGVESQNGSGGWWWDGASHQLHPNGRLRSSFPSSSSLWASWGDFGGLVSVSLALRHSDFAPELVPDEEWCSSKKLSTTTTTTTTTLPPPPCEFAVYPDKVALSFGAVGPEVGGFREHAREMAVNESVAQCKAACWALGRERCGGFDHLTQGEGADKRKGCYLKDASVLDLNETELANNTSGEWNSTAYVIREFVPFRDLLVIRYSSYGSGVPGWSEDLNSPGECESVCRALGEVCGGFDWLVSGNRNGCYFKNLQSLAYPPKLVKNTYNTWHPVAYVRQPCFAV